MLITTCLISNFSFAEDMQISNPPVNIPVCLGDSCPYQIKRDNYLIEINCATLKTSLKNYQCILTASKGNQSISKNIGEDFDSGNISYVWLTPTLLEIQDIHEGDVTPYYCNRAFFIDFNKMTISPLFYSVYAVNTSKMIVLADSSSMQDETVNQTIYIMPMFNPIQNIAISRNFGLYDHDIYHEPMTRFLNNGNLQLSYINAQHKKVEEVIVVNYKAFKPNLP